MEIDDTDRRIVNALLADGTADPTEVAAETGIPATTVDRRIETLEDEGVIESDVPAVEYERLGYDVRAVFQLDVDGDGLARIVDDLEASDRMTSVYEVTGSYDVVAVGTFTSTAAMNERIKELLTDPDVRTANTSVVLNVVCEGEQFPVDLDGE